MINYNKVHYDEFSKNLHTQDNAVGHDIRKWWDDLTGFEETKLLSKILKREELKCLCKNDSPFTDKECLAAIMAWGGQRRNNAKILFRRFDEVQPIISDLRNGKINHIDSYNRFYKIGGALGMRAPYFTKVIFFCDPKHQGFIMDQWTAKSTNLLCEEKVIDLTKHGLVTGNNCPKIYERFCNIVCDLSGKLSEKKNEKISPEKIEMAMFSQGGYKHKRGAWREYVIEHWPKMAHV